MARIASQIAPGSPEFAANAARMQALIAETAALAEQTMRGGDAKSRDRHVARGKLLPRDRVENLRRTLVCVMQVIDDDDNR